jgi:anaerobic sulfite reductase subunit A
MEKDLSVQETRENMYGFLSRLYILEVNPPLLASLQALRFPEDRVEPELAEGYEIFQEYLVHCSEDSLDDLAVDYARVFLAAGVAQGLAAFPYESVYTGKHRIVAQEARSGAAAAYAARGLALGDKMPKVPEDHAAVEMAFMAHLCREAGIPEQRKFFDSHLQNWVPAFCRDVEKYAHTCFYRGLGRITGGFLKLERDYFQAAC